MQRVFVQQGFEGRTVGGEGDGVVDAGNADGSCRLCADGAGAMAGGTGRGCGGEERAAWEVGGGGGALGDGEGVG